MATPLRCLLVEDSASDAGLIVRALQKAGYEVVHQRVETASQMRAALETQVWDLVISGYRLPEFSASNALALLQQIELDLPFIVISGAIGEQSAVEMMKAGAADYLLKGDLARLGTAIESEIGDAVTRRQRRRTQDELRESERRYRELFENSQFGVYRSTPDGRILLVNPTLLAMLGYSSLEELTARNLEAEGFEPECDRGWFKDALEWHGKIRDHEARWTRRDGSPIHVLESAVAVRDSDGAILHCDGTVEDITARKRTADALGRSEERFRQVAEEAGAFVWEVDADGLYTYVSSVVETILGYAPEELVGRLHYYDLFAPDHWEELKAIATEAFAQRRAFASFLNASSRKDGVIVILETSGVPLLDAAGNLVGYRGTDRDVSDRARATEELRRHRDHLEELVRERTAELEAKQMSLVDEVLARNLALEALKRSEAQLQLQLNSMPDACITVGPDFRIRSWNPAAERVFGHSTTEAIGAPAVDLVFPEDLRSELRPFLRGLLKATGTVHKVNVNVTKDGRRITCEWTNTRLLDDDGTVRGILCMVQDITARRLAEEALTRKTEELEMFNKAMIGREKRLIGLKEEINRLCAELGRPPAYPPVWDEDKQRAGPVERWSEVQGASRRIRRKSACRRTRLRQPL